MIADGQVLGFFRDKAHPFMRTTVDNPVVDVQLTNLCAVKSSIVRSAIRKRCSEHILTPSSLTAREMRALDTFSLKLGRSARDKRVCDDEIIGLSSAEEAERAAAYIFSSFFARQRRDEAEREGNETGSSSEAGSSGVSATGRGGQAGAPAGGVGGAALSRTPPAQEALGQEA